MLTQPWVRQRRAHEPPCSLAEKARWKVAIGKAVEAFHGASEVHLASATKGAGAGAGASGGCGAHVAFSISVTFAALPATPIPNVAAPTVPTSTAAAKGAHAEQVSAHTKGARR